jgi:hypothetical protein
LAQATLGAVRDVFSAEVPHYFRHAYSRGPESVAPRVEYAAGLEQDDPRCVVSVIACTGDWTGGWDNTPPGGADLFITEDGQAGRLIEVIERGEPACLLAHWTGIWFNGEELGFRVFQEVVRRLHARYDHLQWMKLSEIARYWAAKELTRIVRIDNEIRFRAPFATPAFTVRFPWRGDRGIALRMGGTIRLREIDRRSDLSAGTWVREGPCATVCFDLVKGQSAILETEG